MRATPRAIDGVDALAVEVEPQLRDRPFKGSLAGVTLVTPVGSARCGVPVVTGETYLIFAARSAREDDVAWFDACGGSRLYAGGARSAETSPFVGLPVNRIVPRLFDLAEQSPSSDAPRAAAEPPLFHTSPACFTRGRRAARSRDPRAPARGDIRRAMRARRP